MGVEPKKALCKAAKDYKQYQQAYDAAEKNSMYDDDWQQKFLLKQLAIKLKREQMSKQQFKVASRKSVFSEIGEYCYLSKENYFIEGTEWTNGDGFDLDLSSLGEQRIAITYGQFKLLKKLVKQLENNNE